MSTISDSNMDSAYSMSSSRRTYSGYSSGFSLPYLSHMKTVSGLTPARRKATVLEFPLRISSTILSWRFLLYLEECLFPLGAAMRHQYTPPEVGQNNQETLQGREPNQQLSPPKTSYETWPIRRASMVALYSMAAVPAPMASTVKFWVPSRSTSSTMNSLGWPLTP